MKFLHRNLAIAITVFVTFLLLLLLSGCKSLDSLDSKDSSDSNDQQISELQRQATGCWNWQETRNGDGTQPNVNQTGVITSGPGNSRELNCKEDGTYTDTFMQNGETNTISGTWTVEEGNKICFTSNDGEFRICYDGSIVDGILQLIHIATEGNISYWNLQSFGRGCPEVQ